MNHHHTKKPYFVLSPETRLRDARAFLDSYACLIAKNGRILIEAPMHWLEMGTGEPARSLADVLEPIDRSLDISLVRFAAPTEDPLHGIRERQTRWPFFVEEPMAVHIAFGNQWVEYRFMPGKTYEVRHRPVPADGADPAQSASPEAK